MRQQVWRWQVWVLFVLVVGLTGPMVSWAAENPGSGLAKAFASLPVTAAGDQARIRLLSGNEEAWYARWNLLDSAKKSITCTYFIIDQDVFGWSFLGMLRKKAKQGVRIRLMVDDRFLRGAKKLRDYDELEELAREPNVEIRIYNLDPLSMVINSEVVAVVHDTSFARRLALRMQADFGKCLEYKIRREADGRVTVVFGPEDHVQAEVLKKLENFGRLKWLRPLI